MTHFIEKCKECEKVISQCRCPDLNKTIRWGICKECSMAMENKEFDGV